MFPLTLVQQPNLCSLTYFKTFLIFSNRFAIMSISNDFLFMHIWTYSKYSDDIYSVCGWLERLTANATKSQQPWVQSQHPPTQWNLRVGRWSSVWIDNLKNKIKIPPEKLKKKIASFNQFRICYFLNHNPLVLVHYGVGWPVPNRTWDSLTDHLYRCIFPLLWFFSWNS